MSLLFVILPILFALPAHVQPGESRHLAAVKHHSVFVIDENQREWQGRLLDVSKGSLTIEGETGAHRFSLSEVRRVDADGDSVMDGALKGAVFGGLVGLALSEIGGGRLIFQSVLTYGAIGMGLDALNRCKQTVYRAPAPQLAVSVRW